MPIEYRAVQSMHSSWRIVAVLWRSGRIEMRDIVVAVGAVSYMCGLNFHALNDECCQFYMWLAGRDDDAPVSLSAFWRRRMPIVGGCVLMATGTAKALQEACKGIAPAAIARGVAGFFPTIFDSGPRHTSAVLSAPGVWSQVMGFRFRRRFRTAPDLHINVSKRSTRTTVGIPGTGISYREQMPRTPVRHGHPKTGGVVAAIALSALVLLAIALA